MPDIDYTAVAMVVVAAINGWAVVRVAKLGRTIKLLEENTNSIKDALVKTTREQGLLEGEKEGRAAERAEQDREDAVRRDSE